MLNKLVNLIIRKTGYVLTHLNMAKQSHENIFCYLIEGSTKYKYNLRKIDQHKPTKPEYAQNSLHNAAILSHISQVQGIAH